MPRIHVCSLARVPATVERTGAARMVTLINPDYPVERPAAIRPEHHLYLGVSDINEHVEGEIAPDQRHVRALLDFVRDWDRRTPLLIHCFAGISRSTAAAFIATCALKPQAPEAEIAWLIRERSPTATPNARLVEIGDALLGRSFRMTAAIASISHGVLSAEGVPFHIDID